MAFWGVEVKSGSPFTLKANESSGLRLHLSQATLGYGNGTERSILQCTIGNKSPVLLCALSPDKVDSHQLNLEFDEANEVIFSVLGPRSLHLSGYFIDRSTGFFVDRTSEPNDDDKSESYGEDIGYSDMERSSSDDYDYSDSFINDEDSHVSSTDDDELSNAKSEKPSEARTLDKRWNESSSDVLPSQNGDATLSNKKRTRDMIEETSDVLKIQLECSETKKQATDKNFEKEAATQKPLEIEKAKLDGKNVSILYTGKLFDSNLGEAPLTFRLGGEEVIEGLSIGVEALDVINTNTNTKEPLREDVSKNAWLGRQ